MNEAKLRRTSAGGYARGDETRQRIIEAAIELFGERGFAGRRRARSPRWPA